MFNAHINVKVSANIRSVKYLFKYVYKGPDCVAAVIADPTNKIQQYIYTQYLSVVEGVDSLLLFKKHTKLPLVTRLVVHFPGQHNVIFNKNEDLAVVAEHAACQKTTLTAYYLRIMFKMKMGKIWCMQTSLLIMFGKFEKKFGRPDNEEEKLLGECISYILLLMNASSFASYLLLYHAQPLSNISGLLMT
jgi:hypothetical protein